MLQPIVSLSLHSGNSLNPPPTAPFTAEYAQPPTLLKTHPKEPGEVLPEVSKLG